jgi:REP element-mobilizing transposase RayT
MARRRHTKQCSLQFRTWGGQRAGAGRPRTAGAKLRHETRPELASRFPVHVTLRAVPSAPNLRARPAYAVVDAALRGVLPREDFRVVHFSVQTNHLHLIVEAVGAGALARGMQALAIRVALGVNRAIGRRGKLWGDRYHARALRTPREVRHALCYVLQNARRHATGHGRMLAPGWIDPCSSGPTFDGWRDAPSPGRLPVRTSTSRATTWLLAVGWRRCGLVQVDEVPAAAG